MLCVHTPKWHLEEGGWLLLVCFTLHGALHILNPTGPVFRQLILDRGDLISRRTQVMVYSPCKQTRSRYFLALLWIALSDELTLKHSIKNWKKSQTHQLFSSKMSSQHFVFSCRWHLQNKLLWVAIRIPLLLRLIHTRYSSTFQRRASLKYQIRQRYHFSEPSHSKYISACYWYVSEIKPQLQALPTPILHPSTLQKWHLSLDSWTDLST